MSHAQDFSADELAEFGVDNNSPKQRKKKSPKGKDKDEPVIVLDDDEFYKKWAGPLIIGPFMPAVLAVFVILSGQIVLNTWTGTCGYSLNSFVSAAIAVCYIFLMIYTWIFIGDTIRYTNQSLGLDMKILVPFKSLRFLMTMYFLVALLSFIIWIVGTILLNLSVFCAKTAPLLYNYSKFLVGIYWFGFAVYAIYAVKLVFGVRIVKLFKETTREVTVDEVEEKLFRRQFNLLDPEGEGRIPHESVPKLLEALGVFVPEAEQKTLIQTFDPDKTGFCGFDEMAAWFKKLNAELNDKPGIDDDDSDEDAEQVGKLFG